MASNCSMSCRARCGKAISTPRSTMPRTCRPRARRHWSTRLRRPRVSGRRRNSNSTEAEMANSTPTPVGVNHIVLNVRDIEESHKFWTEIIGLKQVGALHPRAEMGQTPRMQFYSGDHGDGKLTHHDVAI